MLDDLTERPCHCHWGVTSSKRTSKFRWQTLKHVRGFRIYLLEKELSSCPSVMMIIWDFLVPSFRPHCLVNTLRHALASRTFLTSAWFETIVPDNAPTELEGDTCTSTWITRNESLSAPHTQRSTHASPLDTRHQISLHLPRTNIEAGKFLVFHNTEWWHPLRSDTPPLSASPSSNCSRSSRYSFINIELLSSFFLTTYYCHFELWSFPKSSNTRSTLSKPTCQLYTTPFGTHPIFPQYYTSTILSLSSKLQNSCTPFSSSFQPLNIPSLNSTIQWWKLSLVDTNLSLSLAIKNEKSYTARAIHLWTRWMDCQVSLLPYIRPYYH